MSLQHQEFLEESQNLRVPMLIDPPDRRPTINGIVHLLE